ncbi:keratin, type II cytoskeletal 8-like [Pristis pectinata]|uniref:keratin, type II cytoskeletal 8-like n=1 Tax=Pristis pectinata TaxID=685728 RepID=UPI00223D1956|nr:keratin, type II cytoskeletal 8-like [Pristis pectinata]
MATSARSTQLSTKRTITQHGGGFGSGFSSGVSIGGGGYAGGYGSGYGSGGLARTSFRSSVGSSRGVSAGKRAYSIAGISTRPAISTSSQFRLGSGLSATTAALDLNAPLPTIDTSLQRVREQETKELTSLNNQFVSFIDRVRYLEEVNTQLKIKRDLLKKQGTYTSNIDNMFQAYIDNLNKQLESLGQEKLKFESDLVQMQGLVEDFKGKYEDEINKRTEMENEFVMVKKDVDESYMNKVELEAKLESLMDEIEFLKTIFQEEIRELEAQIQNTSVSVQVDTGRTLDVAAIINEVKAQYQMMADRNRLECDQWKKAKMNELSMAPGGYGDEMRTIKLECNELHSRIRKLTSDIDQLKQQRLRLEAAITEAEERGEMSLRESKETIVKLQEAIQKAKQEITKQMREIEELMHVKMSLDIEINTYQKLLEGEEARMLEGVKTLNIQQVQQQGSFGDFNNLSSQMSGFLKGSSEMESSLVYSEGTPVILKSVNQTSEIRSTS